MKELNEARRELHLANAELNYLLELFGDDLAKREKYQSHKGLDAIHFYICQNFHYLPSDVFSMKIEDLRFLLAEEMSNWTVSKPLKTD